MSMLWLLHLIWYLQLNVLIIKAAISISNHVYICAKPIIHAIYPYHCHCNCLCHHFNCDRDCDNCIFPSLVLNYCFSQFVFESISVRIILTHWGIEPQDHLRYTLTRHAKYKYPLPKISVSTFSSICTSINSEKGIDYTCIVAKVGIQNILLIVT